ncbi:hypothetical protein NP493_7522g00000 [Ridgeia piscesae]|uniref:Uncharacterized protein n=1 Tax=Ridgeia piscesae TaxID=27915 RepID=A0AAD9IQK8_RIDPI|nr:hypothetical protein NP493_7522g00000 [Ridgeia piscesae]
MQTMKDMLRDHHRQHAPAPADWGTVSGSLRLL